jgi:hypothetical protein
MQNDTTEKQRLHRRAIRNERRKRFIELTKTGMDGVAASRQTERELPFDGPATAPAMQIAKATPAPRPQPVATIATPATITPKPASAIPAGAVARKVDFRPELKTEWRDGRCQLTAESKLIARTRATKSFEVSQAKQADEAKDPNRSIRRRLPHLGGPLPLPHERWNARDVHGPRHRE